MQFDPTEIIAPPLDCRQSPQRVEPLAVKPLLSQIEMDRRASLVGARSALLLENQVAIVTGASGGIGQAIALALAAEGATLGLIGRNVKKLEGVAKAAYRTTAARAHTYPKDLTSDDDLRKLKEDLRRDFDRVDLVIHSAGCFFQGPLETASVKRLDLQYLANVRGPYALTQALLPMLKASKGQIAFINSSVIYNSRANVCQFAATQHALKAIADCLRQEVNHAGVRVLSVFPGRTATPRQENIHRQEDKVYRPEMLIQPQDVASVLVNALSLPRTVEVTDITMRPLLKSY